MRVSIATQLNSTELSCDAINGPLVEWRKLDHSIVVAAISQWRRRLSACVTARGVVFVVQCVKLMLITIEF